MATPIRRPPAATALLGYTRDAVSCPAGPKTVDPNLTEFSISEVGTTGFRFTTDDDAELAPADGRLDALEQEWPASAGAAPELR